MASYLMMDAVTAAMLRGCTQGDEMRLDPRAAANGQFALPVAVLSEPAFAVGAGVVTLNAAPDEGVAVSASFLFDVPVRFAEDRLSVSRATFLAGMAASVPLVEIRE